MNWLQLSLIPLGVYVIILVCVFWNAYRNKDSNYCFLTDDHWSYIVGCFVLCSTVGSLTIVATTTTPTYHEEGYIERYELISLNNQPSTVNTISGSFILGTGSFYSTSRGTTNCNFITKDTSGRIIVRTIDTDRITFYIGEPKVEVWHKSFYFPRKLGEESRENHHSWYPEYDQWTIYIPENEVKHYINFN